VAEKEVLRVLAETDEDGETQGIRIEIDGATRMDLWSAIEAITQAYPSVIIGPLKQYLDEPVRDTKDLLVAEPEGQNH
jgi:hypothetical protein